MIAEYIKEEIESLTDIFQFALVLEVCSDKPGNITPEHDFEDTLFIDFIQGSVRARPVLRKAIIAGYNARMGDKKLSAIGVGALIKEAVERSQKDRLRSVNTHLGTFMLLMPLAAAVGLGLARQKGSESLRFNLKNVLEHTTVDDAVNLFHAINKSKAGGLGVEGEMDVNDQESINLLREKDLSLRDLMAYSANKDRVSSELANCYPIVFDEGAPQIIKLHTRLPDIREVLIQTFLFLLAHHPDTLIARKLGKHRAAEISQQALDVLGIGGIFTPAGREALKVFDRILRKDGNMLNPGTTADLVTASLVIALLTDLRV